MAPWLAPLAWMTILAGGNSAAAYRRIGGIDVRLRLKQNRMRLLRRYKHIGEYVLQRLKPAECLPELLLRWLCAECQPRDNVALYLQGTT
jgi:hypothetical protein